MPAALSPRGFLRRPAWLRRGGDCPPSYSPIAAAGQVTTLTFGGTAKQGDFVALTTDASCATLNAVPGANTCRNCSRRLETSPNHSGNDGGGAADALLRLVGVPRGRSERLHGDRRFPSPRFNLTRDRRDLAPYRHHHGSSVERQRGAGPGPCGGGPQHPGNATQTSMRTASTQTGTEG